MTNQAASDEQQLRLLEDQVHEAFLERDTETLDRILDDGFVFTNPDGRLVTKGEWIADMKSGELTFEAIHINDLQVRLYGDAAVTNGRVTMKGQAKEGGFNEQYCYTCMYVRRDGRWQAVAEQANLLSQG